MPRAFWHWLSCSQAFASPFPLHTNHTHNPPPPPPPPPPARAPPQVIGVIDGSGRVVLKDAEAPEGSPTPVDLDLEKVLGDMPKKTFK